MNTNQRRVRSAVAVLFGVLILIAAACSGGSNDSAEARFAPAAQDMAGEPGDAMPPAAAPAPEFDAERPEDTGTGEGLLGSGGVALASIQPLSLGRDIIFRADLTVAVADVQTAGDRAAAVIEALGGFLFGQQTTGGPRPQSILTFKILPENFQAAVDQLGDIGDVRNQNISASDVTDRVVDLESRITTAEASVTRLREFLAEARDISTIAELERELLNRETTLETLRGQLRTLEDQVALATIILTLTEADISPDMFVSVSSYLGHDDAGQSCPGGEEPVYEQDDDVTVCFEIFNTGDTSLTEFTLRDSVLEVELTDLIVVFGDKDLLEPGQSLVLAAEVTLDRDLRTQTRVTAEPVNEETGATIEDRTVSRTETSFFFAEDPGGLPGFGDALSGSWDALKTLGGFVVVAAGVAVPFLWVLVLAGIVLWWRRRRGAGEDEAGREGDQPSAGA
jgi:hypothetical protein